MDDDVIGSWKEVGRRAGKMFFLGRRPVTLDILDQKKRAYAELLFLPKVHLTKIKYTS
jgi:hypothetical protein